MTEDILQRPITFVVKVSRTRTEVALIPVVAMTADEAKAKAWVRRAGNHHEWRISASESGEKLLGIVDTRGFADEFQTEQYKKEMA
jgi:uncharacterized protein with PIN domain